MSPDDKTVGYVRVSTSNQVEKGEGLEIQRNRIKEFCNEKSLKLIKIYEDAGISGAVRDREGLLELLKDCEQKRIDRVVVYKQDRLSRELTVALWLETQFKKYGIELSSVVDPEYDLEDPLQKAFKRIADVFAELERDVIAARLKEGRINKAKNGERGSGPVPFGYKKVDGKMIIDGQESVWVEKIFRWTVRGFSYSKTVRELNKRGIQTHRKKNFNIESVKYILRNRLYYGEMNFGEVKREGAHEAIISKRLFMKAYKTSGA